MLIMKYTFLQRVFENIVIGEVLSLVRVDDASESSSIAASQHQHRPAASAACSGAEAATDAVELEVRSLFDCISFFSHPAIL